MVLLSSISAIHHNLPRLDRIFLASAASDDEDGDDSTPLDDASLRPFAPELNACSSTPGGGPPLHAI